jgi:hypothetical protein
MALNAGDSSCIVHFEGKLAYVDHTYHTSDTDKNQMAAKNLHKSCANSEALKTRLDPIVSTGHQIVIDRGEQSTKL